MEPWHDDRITPRPGIAMSIYVMSQVWAGSQHKGAALLLMLALADFAHDDGTNAYPSVATLARKTRMSDRQVQRLIQQCERSGELVAERSTDGLHSTRYSVVLSALNVTGGKMSPAYRRLGPGDNVVTRNVPKETSEAGTTKEEAQRIWAAALDQLRARGILASNIRRLEELHVTLEGPALVIDGPADLAAKWTDYLRVMLDRPVRFTSG